MKAQDIYHKIKEVADPYHAYTDQMVAISKWVESDFDYNPHKIKSRQIDMFIPDASRRDELLSAFSWVSLIGEQFFDGNHTIEELVDAYLKTKK